MGCDWEVIPLEFTIAGIPGGESVALSVAIFADTLVVRISLSANPVVLLKRPLKWLAPFMDIIALAFFLTAAAVGEILRFIRYFPKLTFALLEPICNTFKQIVAGI